MNHARYIISDAAKKVNVESHVLRYWEEELDLDIPRNEMGHRYYREEDIKLLLSIKQLKEEGFQLRAIKMILPDIGRIEKLDPKSILKLREELNEQVFSMDKVSDEKGTVPNDMSVVAFERKSVLAKNEENSLEEEIEEVPVEEIDKMGEFKAIMHNLILDALKENNQELCQAVTGNISERVIKEMDYIIRVQDERDEERFKKLDECIRGHQKSRKEIAASEIGKQQKKKKKGFFRK